MIVFHKKKSKLFLEEYKDAMNKLNKLTPYMKGL